MNRVPDPPSARLARAGYLRGERLYHSWGGRIPTWEEFRQADAAGRVKVSTRIANNMMRDGAHPRPRLGLGRSLLYGVAGAIVPIVAIYCYFAPLPLYVMLFPALIALAALGAVRRLRARDVITLAKQDAALYFEFAHAGVFEFYPRRD